MEIELLNSISETMLLTLYARAIETKSENPIIIDKKAVEITDKLNEYFINSNRKFLVNLARNKMQKTLVASISLRSKAYDNFIKNFLQRNPKSVVINLGCGLDTKFFRLDNKEVIWYELDFEDVIHLKREFIPESERFRYLPNSVTDLRWTYEIQKHKRKVMFISEGLFMYLNKNDVQAIVLELANRFTGSELLCEIANEYVVKLMKSKMFKNSFSNKFKLKKGVSYNFGLTDSKDMEKWTNKIKFIDEWTYFDENHSKLGLINAMGNFEKLRKTQWTALYKFI